MEPARRQWTIDVDPNIGAPDERQVFRMHEDLAVIMTRIGGTISGTAVRRQIDDGSYVTIGYVYRWESFTPAVKPVEERAEAPEPQDLRDEIELEAAALEAEAATA